MAERKVVLVRLRPAHYEALRRWAADEYRSLNGQMEYIVAQALREAGRLQRRPGADAEPEVDAS